jgi:hypothetical protein
MEAMERSVRHEQPAEFAREGFARSIRALSEEASAPNVLAYLRASAVLERSRAGRTAR